MRLRATLADEFVTNPSGKGQIREGAMQVPEFAPAEAEFNAAEAMVVRRHALPTRNSLPHCLDCCAHVPQR